MRHLYISSEIEFLLKNLFRNPRGQLLRFLSVCRTPFPKKSFCTNVLVIVEKSRVKIFYDATLVILDMFLIGYIFNHGHLNGDAKLLRMKFKIRKFVVYN